MNILKKNDDIVYFLNDCLDHDINHEIHTKILYKKYESWCSQNKFKLLRPNTFSKSLNKLPLQFRRSDTNSYLCKYKLK